MKLALLTLLALPLFFSAESQAGSSCKNATTYEEFCSSCHRLPITKRECLQAGNPGRAKQCFSALGDVVSFHGPAVYRACYAAPDSSRIFPCARMKYHSRAYVACLQGN